MLNSDERDFQRLAAALTGNSVGDFRTRVATGFLDCARRDWSHLDPMREEPHWDSRLARTTVTDEEIEALEWLGKGSYEAVVDGLVSLWIEEMKRRTAEEQDQRGWEEHVLSVHGEPDDWWP
jgi:hypothetical protein